MGKCTFAVTATGKNLQDAFQNARSAERHSAQATQGYSGTIYETYEVREITMTGPEVSAMVKTAPKEQQRNYRQDRKAVGPQVAQAYLMLNIDHPKTRQDEVACAIKINKSSWVIFGWARC